MNYISATEHQDAVSALVKAGDAEFLRVWNEIKERCWPGSEHMPIGDDRLAIRKEQREVLVQTLHAAGKMPAHQRAINVLFELACFPKTDWSVPYTMIPNLFRLAIEERKDEQEAAILRCALPLLEHGESETAPTPEQREFYNTLAFWKANGLRVKYDPQNIPVQ